MNSEITLEINSYKHNILRMSMASIVILIVKVDLLPEYWVEISM